MHSEYTCECLHLSPSQGQKRDVLRAYIKHPDKNKDWMQSSVFLICSE